METQLVNSRAEFFLFFAILVIIILKFSGMPDQYYNLFYYSTHKELFPLDIYFNNTFFFNSSVFFAINALINGEKNDVIGFFFYLITTGTGVALIAVCINRHLISGRWSGTLFLVLLLCFLGRDIPPNTWGGIISLGPGTATMLAKTMVFASFFLMLERHIFAAAVVTAAVLVTHILGDFILFGILFFFILLDSRTDNRKLVYLLIPLVAVGIKKYFSATTLLASGEEARALYDLVLEYGRQDAYFTHQGIPAMVVFSASFLFFPFMWKKLPSAAGESFLPLIKAIYFSALCVACGAIVYTSFISEYLPIPVLIMIAPVRAMNYYTLVFYLVAFFLIIRTDRLDAELKAACLIALVLLHMESLKGVIYPAMILIVGFAGRFAYKMIQKKALFLPAPSVKVITAFLLIGITAIQIQRGGVYQTNFSANGWKYLDRWTVNLFTYETTWKAAAALRSRPNDMVLLPIFKSQRSGKYETSSALNVLAEKSQFVELGHHFYFNYPLLLEHRVRQATKADVLMALDEGRDINPQDVKVLRSRNAVVLVPQVVSSHFQGWAKQEHLGEFTLIQYAQDAPINGD
jgi:hypothetical protein